MNRLRPHPHRGDVIAAGAVPLAVAAFVIELRMGQWALGPRFGVVALTAGLLLTMGWLAELEGTEPRSYHSILLVAGLLLLALALVLFAEVLGSSRPPGDGGLFWTFAVESLLAGVAARRANSGACTLIAAIAAVVAVEAFVSWAFQPQGLGSFRAMLLVLTIAFAIGAVRLRDRHRRHAVQLVNAGGLATLLLGVTYAYSLALLSLLRGTGGLLTLFGGQPATAPFGWKLFILAVGFALLAYAAADHESGPAYVGTAVLFTFVLLVGIHLGRGSLVGWPLFLLLIGAAGLAVGLRPRRPLPPPPPTEPAPTIRLQDAPPG